MKKIIPCFIVFALVFSSCVTGGEKELTQEAKREQEIIEKERIEAKKNHNKAEKYLSRKRNNPDIYWGEGIANIDGDLGLCKIKARKRAINNLAEQIEVKVKSDVEMVVNKNAVIKDSDYSEDVKKSFEQKLQTYTSQVLTNLNESEIFHDYPAKGSATYFVYINKADYEKKVKKDLKQKKDLVTANLKNGDLNFKKENYVSAIKDYTTAKQMKSAFFSDLPVYEDIDKNGIKEDVSILLKNRVSSFFSNLELTLLNKDFTYTAEGIPEKIPEIYAQYKDENNNKHPVKGLDLKIETIKGKAEVKSPVTGSYGETELSISKIDPSYKKTVLKVSVDKEKLTKSSNEIYTSPELKIDFERKKSVAVAAVFFNNGKTYLPKNIKNHIKSSVLDRKFSVIDLSYKDSQNQDLSYLNADFLIVVKISSAGGGSVGNYSNMNASNCSASVSLYSLPLKNLISQKNISAKKGFGVDQQSAGWDGFGKNRSNIINKADEIIKRIQ